MDQLLDPLSRHCTIDNELGFKRHVGNSYCTKKAQISGITFINFHFTIHLLFGCFVEKPHTRI